MMICRRCHRELRNPEVIFAGIGRVCARKELDKYDLSEHGRSRSHYTFDVEPGRILVLDQDDGVTSVTNDAHGIIGDLAALGLLVGRRVFYRDTMGRWDEMVHQNGRFVRFAPGVRFHGPAPEVTI